MTTPRIVLHAGATGILYYGFSSLGRLQVYPEIKAQFGGFWQYLTIQGLFLAGLAMAMSLVLDVLRVPSFRFLKRAKRLLLIVALPLSVVISCIYWILVLFFPRLILPEVTKLSDDSASSKAAIEMFFHLPLDIDLSLHAAPAVALALDFFLFEHKFGQSTTRVLAPLVAMIYTVVYSLWIEYCGTKNDNIFPYPFLTKNSFSGRLMIYAGAGLMAPLSFWLLNSLHV